MKTKRTYSIESRITSNLARRIRDFTDRPIPRAGLFGCSPSELVSHIQSKFTDGMTWDNYGEWEIDHIKACSLFDMEDDAHVRECSHYSNLQPLWMKDNRRKGINETQRDDCMIGKSAASISVSPSVNVLDMIMAHRLRHRRMAKQ